MSYEIENGVKNNVLYFLSTALNSLSLGSIVTYSVGFYKEEMILQAKEMLFKICREKLVQRRSCAGHPNPLVADVEDMMSLFDKMESKKFLMPQFLAEHYASLPPQSGFESMATILCSLREEITYLRNEVSDLRLSNDRNNKCFEDFNAVRQDLTDIKTILRGNLKTETTTSYASVVTTQEPEIGLNNSAPISADNGSRSAPLILKLFVIEPMVAV